MRVASTLQAEQITINSVAEVAHGERCCPTLCLLDLSSLDHQPHLRFFAGQRATAQALTAEQGRRRRLALKELPLVEVTRSVYLPQQNTA